MIRSRRNFIKGLCATGILIQTPLFTACQNEHAYTPVLSFNHQEIAKSFFQILFPDKLAPGYEKINALFHLNMVLTDPLADPDETEYLKNGFKWTNETAQETYKKDFIHLNAEQKVHIFDNVWKTSWGESWLSRLLTIIFEALLIDPIYEVNLNEAGWKWLHHTPGLPRPNDRIIYPLILERKKESKPITHINQL